MASQYSYRLVNFQELYILLVFLCLILHIYIYKKKSTGGLLGDHECRTHQSHLLIMGFLLLTCIAGQVLLLKEKLCWWLTTADLNQPVGLNAFVK